MTGRVRLALVGCVAMLALPPAAAAETFTPTRFDDPGPLFICTADDCSLREAVLAANAAEGADTIVLAAGTYELEIGDLEVTDDLTMTGQGMGATTIDAGGGDRALDLDPNFGGSSPVVAISDLTITNGAGSFGAGVHVANEARATLTRVSVSGNEGSSFGGGIFVEGEGVMTVRDSVISDNTLSGSFGSAIGSQSDAAVTIEDSIIAGNRVNLGGGDLGGALFSQNETTVTVRRSTIADNSNLGGDGGGVFLQFGPVLTMEDSTVSGNTTGGGGAGGAGLLLDDAVANLRNVTVSGNRSSQDGGGISARGESDVTVANSTIVGNSADDVGQGGGIFTDFDPGGALEISSSVIAANADPGNGDSHPDCSGGGVTSLGFNVIGDGTGCDSIAGPSDQVGTAGAPIDPQLGALSSNGGPTATHLPAQTSPAIDRGVANSLATDQRGLARTADVSAIPNAPGGDGTDVGAVELQAAPCQGANVFSGNGTAADDALTGAINADALFGLAGDDVIEGLAGDDCIDGGDGNDLAKGSEGRDELAGDAGRDRLKGGAGRDRADGGAGRDKLSGQGGKDKLKGKGGKDKLSGGAGKDKLKGGPGKDRIKTAGGKDRVNCGGGKDKVNADPKDRISANCEKVT